MIIDVGSPDPGRAGELARWLHARDVGARGADVEAGGEEISLRDVIAADPGAVLVARLGSTIVGVLAGSPTAHGYRVDLLCADPPHVDGVVGALLSSLERRWAGRAIEVALPLDGHDGPIWTALRLHGYRRELDEVCVERSLTDLDLAAPDPFDYRDLAEVGRARIVAVMARCALDPSFDASAEADEMFDLAGADLDGTLWTIVHHRAEVVGVLLLHRVSLEPPLGTILFMGVVPEARGRGLGSELHRAALVRLARSGMTDYVDATRADNSAMQRIFTGHGCRTTGTMRTFRRARIDESAVRDES